jgi:hypothetical protein
MGEEGMKKALMNVTLRMLYESVGHKVQYIVSREFHDQVPLLEKNRSGRR